MRDGHSPKLIELVRQRGVVRTRDLAEPGIPRVYLKRLMQQGILVSPSRGLYTLAEAPPNLHQSLLEAAVRVPNGVVCLLSALQFHGLTTQAPFEVWLTLPPGTRTPRVDSPMLRIVRVSGDALTRFVEVHTLDGIPVRVYSPAKTVADCFKFRNRVGLDVALEALRDCWRQKRATMDQLFEAATVCRVGRVIRPYLESLG